MFGYMYVKRKKLWKQQFKWRIFGIYCRDPTNTPPWCPSPAVSSGTTDRSARSRAPSCPTSFLCGGWTNKRCKSADHTDEMVIRISCRLRNNEVKKRRGGDRRVGVRWAYICDDGNAQVSHVGDDLAVLRGNLSMLDQFVQVFLCNTWRQMFVFPQKSDMLNSPRDVFFLEIETHCGGKK